MDREDGFYHVKAMGHWTVAWFSGSRWKFVGSSRLFADEKMDDIGPRITRTEATTGAGLDADGKWPIIPPYSDPCDCGADDAPADQHDLSCPKTVEPPSEKDRLRDAIVAEVAAYTGLRISEATELAVCIAARWIALAQPVQSKTIESGHSDTHGEAMEMFAHLNCPACGGSGHIDDTARPVQDKP
jgi:hypothetical protein